MVIAARSGDGDDAEFCPCTLALAVHRHPLFPPLNRTATPPFLQICGYHNHHFYSRVLFLIFLFPSSYTQLAVYDGMYRHNFYPASEQFSRDADARVHAFAVL